MNKFFALLILITASISGCATTSAPEVGIYNGQQVSVSAKMIPGLIDSEVFLYIDNTLVIKDRTAPLGGSSQSLKGQWNGKPVVARLTQIENLLSSYTQIDVFVAGQLVETLTV